MPRPSSTRGAPLRLVPLLLAASLALAPGCRRGEARPESEPASVELARVAVVDWVDRILATGELLALDQAGIAAEVSGRVTEVLAEEGAAVDAGQVLLEIDPERRGLERKGLRAALEEARAALREERREHERIAQLFDRGVASRTRLDETATALERARSRVAGAEADLGVADRALRDASVSAPFAGLIARRLVSRGEFVEVGQKLVDLVALDPVEVEFRVAERDSGRVRMGQTVAVRVAPYPDESFPAVVSVVSPTIDSASRTLRIKALLDNSQERLRPGLFARVDLGLSTRLGVTAVPEEAILQRAEGPVVFRLGADNRVERVRVEIGAIERGRVEVVRGLSPGDQVVARGHSRLVGGDLVVPRARDGVPLVRNPELAEASEAGP